MNLGKARLKNKKQKSKINIEFGKCHFELPQPSRVVMVNAEIKNISATATLTWNHTRFVKSFATADHKNCRS